MLRRVLGEDIAIVHSLSPALGLVRADPGQIEQVIMNLAVNARDAMLKGGTLTISTGNVPLDGTFVCAHPGSHPGPHVVLTVSDTGAGMSEEVQARIFEPFFTTKEQGKGTGLGLATVYGIVKQSDGCIYCDSTPGRGTTFRIYFPCVPDGPERQVVQPAHESKAVMGSETVLLVEDADPLRRVARRVLAGAGYTVLEADGGRAAIQASERHQSPIHLLLTDVVMPQMNGRQVAEAIRAQRPETRVLFMSGYADDVIVHHGVLEPDTELLEKPFTSAALLRRVRGILGAVEVARAARAGVQGAD